MVPVRPAEMARSPLAQRAPQSPSAAACDVRARPRASQGRLRLARARPQHQWHCRERPRCTAAILSRAASSQCPCPTSAAGTSKDSSDRQSTAPTSESTMPRHEMTDREWARLGPFLPKRRTGRPSRDHRTIIDALLWLAKTGAPWRDLPERFGPWRTVATRFYRWTRSGLWERILAELRRIADAKGKIDWDVHMVDSTSVRAHHCVQHRQALGRSRGGFGSKLHLRCDRRGRPMAFV